MQNGCQLFHTHPLAHSKPPNRPEPGRKSRHFQMTKKEHIIRGDWFTLYIRRNPAQRFIAKLRRTLYRLFV